MQHGKEIKCPISKLIGNTKDPNSELYDYYSKVVVYGYCRTELATESGMKFVPKDVSRLIFLWFHSSTISLLCQGEEGRYFPIMINGKEPVSKLKVAISEREGYACEQIKCVYIKSIGKPLRDDLRLYEYNLHSNDCVQVRLRIRSK